MALPGWNTKDIVDDFKTDKLVANSLIVEAVSSSDSVFRRTSDFAVVPDLFASADRPAGAKGRRGSGAGPERPRPWDTAFDPRTLALEEDGPGGVQEAFKDLFEGVAHWAEDEGGLLKYTAQDTHTRRTPDAPYSSWSRPDMVFGDLHSGAHANGALFNVAQATRLCVELKAQGKRQNTRNSSVAKVTLFTHGVAQCLKHNCSMMSKFVAHNVAERRAGVCEELKAVALSQVRSPRRRGGQQQQQQAQQSPLLTARCGCCTDWML